MLVLVTTTLKINNILALLNNSKLPCNVSYGLVRLLRPRRLGLLVRPALLALLALRGLTDFRLLGTRTGTQRTSVSSILTLTSLIEKVTSSHRVVTSITAM